MIYDVLVVGAGPAGLAAALTAAKRGLHVLVVDEQRQAGGQIFRQLPVEWGGTGHDAPNDYPWAKNLLAASGRANRIAWRWETTAWGLLMEDETSHTVSVGLSSPRGGEYVQARRVLIATGAYDLPVPFPGWTLPGVMMAGAAQTLVKSQRLLPARRLVLAGAHPLLLVAAGQLLDAGADLAAVVLARGLPSPTEGWRSLAAVPGHLGLLGGTAKTLLRLKAARVPILTRALVTQAEGEEHLTSVKIASIDSDWNPRGPTRSVECDGLVLGYGFVPSTELARQAGCEVRWDSPAGGWVVAHDECMRSSQELIYVAGEPSGVAGAEQAYAEGHLAGLAIWADLEEVVAPPDLLRAQRDLRTARRFSRVVQTLFEPRRESLARLGTASTIVCRCELVTAGQIRSVLEENPFLSDVNAVKLECRAGMGLCQGRYCALTVAALTAEQREIDLAHVGSFTARAPVKPIPVSALSPAHGGTDLEFTGDVDVSVDGPQDSLTSQGRYDNGEPVNCTHG